MSIQENEKAGDDRVLRWCHEQKTGSCRSKLILIMLECMAKGVIGIKTMRELQCECSVTDRTFRKHWKKLEADCIIKTTRLHGGFIKIDFGSYSLKLANDQLIEVPCCGSRLRAEDGRMLGESLQ